jgi:16S rRNA (uracil1498-N3)-methyltransferase
MRLHRFYLENDNFESLQIGDIFVCTEKEIVGQISKVLRAKIGDRAAFFNQTGEIVCELDLISTKEVKGRVVEQKNLLRQPKKVFLLQAIIKKDKFEWVAQKGTELGMTDIIPILTERSEKRGLDEKRIRKIMIEATEQSGWGSVPRLHASMTLSEALPYIQKECDALYVLDMDGEVGMMKNEGCVALLVGPEGGWGSIDKRLIALHSVKTLSLGKPVLRAETAAIVGVHTIIN